MSPDTSVTVTVKDVPWMRAGVDLMLRVAGHLDWCAEQGGTGAGTSEALAAEIREWAEQR